MRRVFAILFVLVTVGIAHFCTQDQHVMADELQFSPTESASKSTAANQSAPLRTLSFSCSRSRTTPIGRSSSKRAENT